ncbi:FmdB family zinc ribbon protein [Kroppenstedtia guangzhouensis]|uniref:FmdB family zinc ribbon protein n=1 Tax=Kroppenstedtia guangzhouensis TaxID=1274356 RepID=UPI0016671A9F
MPFYDLKCKDCCREFEVYTSFSKLKEATCPNCSSRNHERIYKANIKGPVTRGGSSPSSGFT